MGAVGRVVDADVGHKAHEDHRVDVVRVEDVRNVRPVEEVVALLGDQVLGGRQVGLVDVEAVVQRRAVGRPLGHQILEVRDRFGHRVGVRALCRAVLLVHHQPEGLQPGQHLPVVLAGDSDQVHDHSQRDGDGDLRGEVERPPVGESGVESRLGDRLDAVPEVGQDIRPEVLEQLVFRPAVGRPVGPHHRVVDTSRSSSWSAASTCSWEKGSPGPAIRGRRRH